MRSAVYCRMGKVEDMRRQREALHGGGSAKADAAGGDSSTGRCSVCRKIKAVKDGRLVSHQRGLGTMCSGSRKEPA